MKLTTTRALTSAMIAAAAAGTIAIGTAGPASAAQHPITGLASHVTVHNYTGSPVMFLTYDATSDPAKSGPATGYIAEPGKDMGFDVDNWALGGHHTVAVISSLHGKHTWQVNMRANSTGTYVMCSTNSACSPNYVSQSVDVALY
jgi:hypothetical protein